MNKVRFDGGTTDSRLSGLGVGESAVIEVIRPMRFYCAWDRRGGGWLGPGVYKVTRLAIGDVYNLSEWEVESVGDLPVRFTRDLEEVERWEKVK